MIININEKEVDVDVSGDTPLLWVLRDHLGLTGAKFGCGVAQCGACTVHADRFPIRSCVTPVQAVGKKKIVTIEGQDDLIGRKVKESWVELNVVQCGYCQTGQIQTAIALLGQLTHPTDDDIDEAMSDNICRCGTYTRIRAAIHLASKKIY